jgi:hypothetical protein
MSKKMTTSKVNDPDSIKDCRVADIGLGAYGECLQNGPCSCSYALPFGYAFLCQHPRVGEIIEKTKQQKQAFVAEKQ